MTLLRYSVIATLATLFIACASSPPETSFYLLRAEVPPGSSAVDPNADVGFGTVSVAPYLDRAGLVVQLAENRVREARYHLWAEPLGHGIRVYLSDRLAATLGRPVVVGPIGTRMVRYRVDVGVQELHGTLNGDVTLVARFAITDLSDDRFVAGERFSSRRGQTGDGYPGLVTTQIALLGELADAIVRELRTLELDPRD